MNIGKIFSIVCVYTALGSNSYVEAMISTLSDIDSEFSTLMDAYYDIQSVIPVKTVGSALAVTVNFDLVSIVDFDDDFGYITLAGYLTVVWTEERYTTVADDINVSVFAASIWTPPLSIVNTLSSASMVGSNKDVLKFNLNTARAEWKPWVYIKVACDSNSFFPFDKQECSLKLSSLSIDNTEMTLSPADNTIGTASFEKNHLWKLESTSVTNHTTDSAPYVVYTLTIRRRSQFLTFILACPMFVISIMHMFVFLISQQNDQRSTFCVMSMIAVLITLLWATTYIPTGATPLSIVVYYLFTEFFLNVVVFVVALVLSNTFKGYDCCINDTCFENLLTERKSEKVSNLGGSGISSVTALKENATTTPNAVRLASVTTAWDIDGDDDDVFYETSNTPEGASKNKTNAETKSCDKSSIFKFVLFMALHLCFTVAFFVPLSLNVE